MKSTQRDKTDATHPSFGPFEMMDRVETTMGEEDRRNKECERHRIRYEAACCSYEGACGAVSALVDFGASAGERERVHVTQSRMRVTR
jgi:hypothetical protein